MTLRTGALKRGNQSASLLGPQSDSAMPKSLICHLNSTEESSVILSGAGVLEWRDISGNGIPMHFRQTTAANQPQWGTKTINGYTVLDWTGGSSSADTPHMYCANNTLQPVVSTKAGSRFWKGWHGGTSGGAGAAPGFTIFCVAQHDSTSGEVNSTRLYGAGDDGHTIDIDNTGNAFIKTRVRDDVGGSTHTTITGTIVNQNLTRVFTHRYTVSNTTTELIVNGVLDVSTTAERFWPNAGSTANYDHHALGSDGDAYRQNYNTPWRGSIAEYMFFDESLPDATKTGIETALMAKWGL